MDLKLIGLLVIGVILLIITGAFVFSASFRKDVIASEGQASILGLFNVKGVVIILLIAIFSGSFIYIIQGERGPLDSLTPVNDSMFIAKTVITSDGPKKKLVYEENPLCEAGSTMANYHENISLSIGSDYTLVDVPGFSYRVDSVWYVGENGKQYCYKVSFGEKKKDGIIWGQDPVLIYKTPDGAITESNRFVQLSDPRWDKHYKVLMSIGQPDALLKQVEKAWLIVVSSQVDMTK